MLLCRCSQGGVVLLAPLLDHLLLRFARGQHSRRVPSRGKVQIQMMPRQTNRQRDSRAVCVQLLQRGAAHARFCDGVPRIAK